MLYNLNVIQKKIVGVLFGGFSGEASVSQQSALNVYDLVDKNLFEKYLIELDHDDEWWLHDDGIKWPRSMSDSGLKFRIAEKIISIDIVCNFIHGAPGEDGQLQHYLNTINVPCTGSGKTTMIQTFDKHLCNTILTDNYFSVAKNYLHQNEVTEQTFDTIKKHLGSLPYFVKPNSGGSSLASGIAHTEPELFRLITAALEVDDSVLIETVLPGREFSIGVFEYNDEIIVLPITEIISDNEFFDFQAKYDGAATEITPAKIDQQLTIELQKLGEDIFRLFDCEDMIRFEVKMDDKDRFKILDINTIPGFTDRSILPQQLKAAKIKPANFVNQMINKNL